MYTAQQVAEILGLSPATVRQLIKRGELPGRQVGRSFRVHKPTFDACLRDLRTARPNPNASWS